MRDNHVQPHNRNARQKMIPCGEHSGGLLVNMLE